MENILLNHPTKAVRIMLRTDYAAAFEALNSIYSEVVCVLDENRIKIGDGQTVYNELPYAKSLVAVLNSLRFPVRSDSQLQWVITNPVLGRGELGLVQDTERLKMGDGVSVWTDLETVDFS